MTRRNQCRNQSKCEGFVGLGADDLFPLQIPSCIHCVLFFIFKMGGWGLQFLAAKRVRNAALHGFISIIWLSPSVLAPFDAAFGEILTPFWQNACSFRSVNLRTLHPQRR
jgi:hypothetical protein